MLRLCHIASERVGPNTMAEAQSPTPWQRDQARLSEEATAHRRHVHSPRKREKLGKASRAIIVRSKTEQKLPNRVLAR